MAAALPHEVATLPRRPGVRLLPFVPYLFASALCAQQLQPGIEALSGPDAHEHSSDNRGHLFGEWGGERQRLMEQGVNFDLQYISDFVWNLRSVQPARLASWNRVRGTVDLDFSRLTNTPGLTFHITALWQTGGNLGAYLGTIAGPSGLASANAFRLDSYWLEKRWKSERITFRVGQFAGQDFYGVQPFGPSFIIEPLDYALGNLNATYETFDPPSTPAAELRLVPFKHFFVKTMVFAADRTPYAHNYTGFVPEFRGTAATVSEIGWAQGQSATSVRAYETVAQRRGYSGFYQLGSAVNPSRFQSTGPTKTIGGNYLIYAIASQAVWRTNRNSAQGLDLTAATDWTPSNRSRITRQTTVGVRYNEPLPIRQHNTMGFGYVQSGISSLYRGSQPGVHQQPEHAFEFNTLIEVTRSVMLQPVVQWFLDAGGTSRGATVFGFRSKVDF